MSETAKAVQEVAKATGQAINTVERVGQFFSHVMKEPIDTTCGMLADTLRFKRWERQVALVDKAEEILRGKNLASVALPLSPKLALPVFHNASLEDDEGLHSIYAKLLVAATDPAMPARRTAFAEILRQVEPDDVRILQSMHSIYTKKSIEHHERYKNKRWYSNRRRPPTWVCVSKREILKDVSIDDGCYWTAVDNLNRLGLVSSYVEEGTVDFESGDDWISEDAVVSYGGYDELCISALGVDFVCICNY